MLFCSSLGHPLHTPPQETHPPLGAPVEMHGGKSGRRCVGNNDYYTGSQDVERFLLLYFLEKFFTEKNVSRQKELIC